MACKLNLTILQIKFYWHIALLSHFCAACEGFHSQGQSCNSNAGVSAKTKHPHSRCIENACSLLPTSQPFPLSLCLETDSSRQPVFSSVSLLNICPLGIAACLSVVLWHKPYRNNESGLVSLPSYPQGLAHCLVSHRCSIKYN